MNIIERNLVIFLKSGEHIVELCMIGHFFPNSEQSLD